MHLYIISNNETIKIGKSKNPEARLNQLQTGSSKKLKLIHTVEVNDDECLYLEQMIHKELGTRRVLGEWFNISDIEHVKKVFEYVIIRYSKS